MFRHIIPTYEYFILHSIIFLPYNTHINLLKFSLSFLGILQHCHLTMPILQSQVFPSYFLADYVMPTYGSWNVNCYINWLHNFYIPTFFPFIICKRYYFCQGLTKKRYWLYQEMDIWPKNKRVLSKGGSLAKNKY